MARFVDVVENSGAAELARVVDDDIAKAHHPLRDACLDRYVLDFAERNVPGGARDETGVDLEFCIGYRVTNRIASNVVISRYQQ